MKVTHSQYARAFYELSQKQKDHSDVESLARNMITLLRRKKSLKQLPSILHHMKRLQEKEQGIAPAKLMTAFVPTNTLMQELEQFACKILESEKVVLDQERDESLLGGFVLRTENYRFDASIARKLQQAKHVLTNTTL